MACPTSFVRLRIAPQISLWSDTQENGIIVMDGSRILRWRYPTISASRHTNLDGTGRHLTLGRFTSFHFGLDPGKLTQLPNVGRERE